MTSGRVEVIGEIGSHLLLEPRVRVVVSSRSGGSGVSRTIEAAIDTGFTGWLTLPPDIIQDLGLKYQGTRRVNLAGGQEWETDLYLGFISWRGLDLPRVVHQSDSNPLVGIGLLTGYRLVVEAVAGGNVTIEEIQPRQ